MLVETIRGFAGAAEVDLEYLIAFFELLFTNFLTLLLEDDLEEGILTLALALVLESVFDLPLTEVLVLTFSQSAQISTLDVSTFEPMLSRPETWA